MMKKLIYKTYLNAFTEQTQTMSSPISIVIVEKAGTLKELHVKHFDELELYKKAGFKTNSSFEQRQVWKNIQTKSNTYEHIAIYGKVKGNAGKENKYDFPPPIDTTLFFGNMVIVHYDKSFLPKNLSVEEWESIYSKLFGGFESLDDSDGEEEEEEEIDPSKLTKYGYEKDGFVVDDDDDDCLEYDSELSEEEYFD
jgi:hypothetical protein